MPNKAAVNTLNVSLLAALLVGCVSQPVQTANDSLPLASYQPTVITSPIAQATAEVSPHTLWVDAAIPATATDLFIAQTGWAIQDSPQTSACSLHVTNENRVADWVYALVAPFDTITDSVNGETFKNRWKNHTADFPVKTIYVAPQDLSFLSAYLGEADTAGVKSLASDKILETAWKDADAWAIIPFDQINPEWKVITIDHISPIRKDFNTRDYLLSIPLGLTCSDKSNLPQDLLANPLGNRDANALTTVVMTGVTAMVRGTAYEMEENGLTYPDRDIRSWLVDADITHVSNEIPYWPKCPPPFKDNKEQDLVFCSNPSYNKLLEDVGTDVVELTGDHFIDYGADATIYTLDMYKKLGWKYYGGGYNRDDARKPALFEHNGNKLAFLGCNAKPPGYATASATMPGAIHCNFDDLTSQIKAVKEQGYLPIVTFQHLEYYAYTINPILQADFERVAEAGAIIVNGSQAHQPHGIEFYKGSFLHFGLGNLFFDQYNEGFPTRQAFMDRHVFYKGKYINTELLSMMFADLARPRPMTDAERNDLLQTIFKVSIWPFSPITVQEPTQQADS
ncbi:MAG: CapA family protein [Anaerolineae bacterium]|nr:CapA family protein [Anaerolineae bacterium]